MPVIFGKRTRFRNRDFEIIEISLYLFIYMVGRTSFSARASHYVLVKRFQFYVARGNPAA